MEVEEIVESGANLASHNHTEQPSENDTGESPPGSASYIEGVDDQSTAGIQANGTEDSPKPEPAEKLPPSPCAQGDVVTPQSKMLGDVDDLTSHHETNDKAENGDTAESCDSYENHVVEHVDETPSSLPETTDVPVPKKPKRPRKKKAPENPDNSANSTQPANDGDAVEVKKKKVKKSSPKQKKSDSTAETSEDSHMTDGKGQCDTADVKKSRTNKQKALSKGSRSGSPKGNRSNSPKAAKRSASPKGSQATSKKDTEAESSAGSQEESKTGKVEAKSEEKPPKEKKQAKKRKVKDDLENSASAPKAKKKKKTDASSSKSAPESEEKDKLGNNDDSATSKSQKPKKKYTKKAAKIDASTIVTNSSNSEAVTEEAVPGTAPEKISNSHEQEKNTAKVKKEAKKRTKSPKGKAKAGKILEENEAKVATTVSAGAGSTGDQIQGDQTSSGSKSKATKNPAKTKAQKSGKGKANKKAATSTTVDASKDQDGLATRYSDGAGVTDGDGSTQLNDQPSDTEMLDQAKLTESLQTAVSDREDIGSDTAMPANEAHDSSTALVEVDKLNEDSHSDQESKQDHNEDGEDEDETEDNEDDGRILHCSQCKYRAKKKVSLRRHMTVHSVFECAHCDFISDTSPGLEDHMMANHPSRCGRKLCKKCNVLFRADQLEEHEENCTGEKHGWLCKECNKTFKFVCVLRAHMKRWHSGDAASRTLSCDKCEFTCALKHLLNIHMRKEHPKEPDPPQYACDQCHRSFKHQELLDNHKETHANMELPCPKCGKVFKNTKRLHIHIKVHDSVPHIPCDVEGCNKIFKEERILVSHKKRCHTPQEPKQFKCDHEGCGVEFFTKYHLKRHERVHSGNAQMAVCGMYVETSGIFIKYMYRPDKLAAFAILLVTIVK